jgi:hypothetical protein
MNNRKCTTGLAIIPTASAPYKGCSNASLRGSFSQAGKLFRGRVILKSRPARFGCLCPPRENGAALWLRPNAALLGFPGPLSPHVAAEHLLWWRLTAPRSRTPFIALFRNIANFGPTGSFFGSPTLGASSHWK